MSTRHEGYEDYEYTLHKFLYDSRSERYHCDCFIKYLKEKAANTENKDVKEECERRIRHIQKPDNHIRNSDIAFIIGKDTSTVDRWVNCAFETEPDKIHHVDVRAIPIIAKAFGLTIDELLLEEPTFDIKKYDNMTLLKEAGIDISSLLNFYKKQIGSEEGFEDVIRALYNLISQRTTPFSILKAIGLYFNSSPSNMKVIMSSFESFSLKSELKSLCNKKTLEDGENADKKIEELFNKYTKPIYNESNVHLDEIVSALKEKIQE